MALFCKDATLGGALAAMVAISGCAQQFPERLNWMGNDPNLYTLAFLSAGTEAYVEAKTGRNYYELLGDKAYSLGGTGLCTESGVQAYLVTQTEYCSVLLRAPTENCTDRKQCIRLRISPALLAEPQYIPVVEAALRNPCGSITDWRTLTWGDVGTAIGMSPKHSMRILHCGDNEVIGNSVALSADNQYFEIKFARRT